jgi:hypothetical protein
MKQRMEKEDITPPNLKPWSAKKGRKQRMEKDRSLNPRAGERKEGSRG